MNGPIETKELCIGNRLTDITLTLPGRSVTCLLGQNGAGKSTLLECLAGLLVPDSGMVCWQGDNLESLSLGQQSSQRCFQAQGDALQFELSAAEYLRFYTEPQHADHIPVELESVLEISSLLNKPFVQLSGGEQQRVSLARTFLQNWQMLVAGECLVILDEPLKGLDIRHQTHLLRYLRELAMAGNQVIFSCHDINAALNCADFAVLLKGGKLVAAGKAIDVVDCTSLSQVFDCEFEFVPALNCGIYLQKP